MADRTLPSPTMILEDENTFVDATMGEDVFVKVDLSSVKDDVYMENNILTSVIDSVYKKYPLTPRDAEHYDVLVAHHIVRELYASIKNIDIIFVKYEILIEPVRRYINNLVRVGCICEEGKLLFHLSSRFTYYELLRQGFSFDTYCDKEKILYNHEISGFPYNKYVESRYFASRKAMTNE